MRIASINEQDRARISAEITAAENSTSGEIYVVIDREIHAYRAVPIAWASLVSLIVPWPLLLFTELTATAILLCQVGLFVVIAAVLSPRSIHRHLVPRALASERAGRTAQAQFMAHGIHQTENRTGVLIYVTLADRCVEIVADAGINAKVPQAAWDNMAKQVTDAARAHALPAGLLSAVREAGKLLAEHFPRLPNDRNELPDRVVEI